MKFKYLVTLDKPENHYVAVRLHVSDPKDSFQFYLPSWSPGSYLMREYSKHLKELKIHDQLGRAVYYEKISKGSWDVSTFKLHPGVKEIYIDYKVYCHDLTVRTSHIDASHAFLHGPSYLIGIKSGEDLKCEIELSFPREWTKVSTGLKDISKDRKDFIYEAENYDVLIDAPIEVGNQLTDGFIYDDKKHFLAFYGETLPHPYDLKKDIECIVRTVGDYMGDIPYEDYTFITHFAPDYFGGLEHLNSTALGFDGRKLADRKSYIRWLTLVTHEYFHTWNVKRIRPKELGPFDYVNENYTRMLWLAEGLTSFMDNYLTLKSGLITESEYWDLVKEDLNRYLSIEGRKFDSLEDSSFDAWIKLYRPHENSSNTTISYYLKGGIVFLCLHAKLKKNNQDIKMLIDRLWQDYVSHPERGIDKDHFLKLITDFAGEEISDYFETMISTTQELDFEQLLKSIDIGIDWAMAKNELGFTYESSDLGVRIKTVKIDSTAYKSGINAGDIIYLINGQKLDSKFFDNFSKYLMDHTVYKLSALRMGRPVELDFQLGKSTKKIKRIVPSTKSEIIW